MKMKEKKSHAVVLPFLAPSHIPPLLHLSSGLATHGFKVTIVTMDSIHDRLLQQWSSNPGSDIHFAKVPCPLDLSEGLTAEHFKQEREKPGCVLAVVDNIGPLVEDLLRTLEPFPRCLISDCFLPDWAPRVAKALNISIVTYWPGSAAWSALHLYEDLLVLNGDAFQDENEATQKDKLISYIPGVSPFEYSDLPEYIRMKHPEPKEKYFRALQRTLSRSEWILVNSMIELEPQTFQAIQAELSNTKYVPVAPVFPLKSNASPATPLARRSLRDEDNSCLEWLDCQEKHSVLYISFGSISSISEMIFQELAMGIQASKVRFLWVVRPDLVENYQKKFEEFREQTQKQGLVVSWVPQLKVLAHSSVGGFLSHCGWNSTLESICNGVPLLCWPFFSDQVLNSKIIVKDWQAGKLFAKQQQKLGRIEVGEKIRDFMHGPDVQDIRSRVQSFKIAAHQAKEPGGASTSSFQAFMREMR